MARLVLVILGMLAVNGVTNVQGQVEPGGYQPIDVDSDDAKNAAELGVSYFEAEDSNDYKLVLVRIIEAEEQIVAGTNVNVTFELGVTKCLKDVPAGESCPFEENAKTRTCNVVVYTNLQQEAKVTESNCDVDPREPKQLEPRVPPGGYNPIDVDSEDAKNAVKLGVSHLQAEACNSHQLVLVKILEAEQQVFIDEKMTNVSFVVGATKCLKNISGDCPLEMSTNASKCYVLTYSSLQVEQEITKSYCDIPLCDKNTVPPGGYYPIDVDSEDAKKAAKLGLSQLQADPCNSHQLVLIKIVEAEEQVVAGKNTNVSFIVGATKCLKNISVDCPLEMSANTSKCNVVVYTPLEGRQKITESHCDIPLCDKNPVVPGGYSPIDVDSEEAKKAAKLGVSYFQAEPCNSYQLELMKIVQAEEQVVAGTNTNVSFVVGTTRCLKNISVDCGLEMSANTSKCYVVVYTPLEGRQKITESNCDIPLCDKIQLKKTIPPGGYYPIDVDSEDAKKAAKYAVSELEADSCLSHHLELIKIVQAEQQVVVAGKNTNVSFVVGTTKCLKNVSGDCPLEMSANTTECDIAVYTPLEGRQTFTLLRCDIRLCDTNTETGSQEETTPGGPTEVNVNDAHIKTLANFVLDFVDQQSNHLYTPKLDEIVKASSQVVAGSLYTIEMRVGFKQCDNCQMTGRQLCTAQVWQRVWLMDTRITSYSCSLEI